MLWEQDCFFREILENSTLKNAIVSRKFIHITITIAYNIRKFPFTRFCLILSHYGSKFCIICMSVSWENFKRICTMGRFLKFSVFFLFNIWWKCIKIFPKSFSNFPWNSPEIHKPEDTRNRCPGKIDKNPPRKKEIECFNWT